MKAKRVNRIAFDFKFLKFKIKIFKNIFKKQKSNSHNTNIFKIHHMKFG